MSKPTGWVTTDAERIAELERQLAEAEALAERRKRAGQILLWFILHHDPEADPGEAVRKYGYAARTAIEELTIR